MTERYDALVEKISDLRFSNRQLQTTITEKNKEIFELKGNLNNVEAMCKVFAEEIAELKQAAGPAHVTKANQIKERNKHEDNRI